MFIKERKEWGGSVEIYPFADEEPLAGACIQILTGKFWDEYRGRVVFHGVNMPEGVWTEDQAKRLALAFEKAFEIAKGLKP